ncbi:calcium-dependent protein kinase 2-like isoform X1 [Canna indica]|uniref:Calcium-dependent protein kinase 2-like isoform X1 n=1 Tax=Canna indica TaxID=4628 RepID=A0AAQ3KRZ7_9LILI|nr:calcium-dependent protein kinase 2-like isoform X1 [Canna indica]
MTSKALTGIRCNTRWKVAIRPGWDPVRIAVQSRGNKLCANLDVVQEEPEGIYHDTHRIFWYGPVHLVIAGYLSEEEIQGLKEMFKSMDSDNSGSITLEELKHGLAKQGTKLTEYEVKQLMEAADADGNETIDYEEFITATMHMNRMDREEHLYTAFQYFDKDNSGYITRDELEQALKEKGMFDEKEIKD